MNSTLSWSRRLCLALLSLTVFVVAIKADVIFCGDSSCYADSCDPSACQAIPAGVCNGGCTVDSSVVVVSGNEASEMHAYCSNLGKADDSFGNTNNWDCKPPTCPAASASQATGVDYTANGQVGGSPASCSTVGSSTTDGATCVVSCDTANGFTQLSGSTTLTCNLASSAWTTNLVCQGPPCTAAPAAATGIILNPNGGGAASGDCSVVDGTHTVTASASCHADCDTANGYTKVNAASPSTYTCSATSGTFSSADFSCLAPCLNPTTASTGIDLNGAASTGVKPCGGTSSASFTAAGSSCSVKCASGYKSNGGPLSLSCSSAQSGQTMSPQPTASCDLACSSPPSLATFPTAGYSLSISAVNGNPTCSSVSSTDAAMVKVGNQCSGDCAAGLTRNGPPSFTCHSGNIWTADFTCGNPCVTPPDAKSGFKVDWSVGTCGLVDGGSHKVSNGGSCTFGCVSGYTPNRPTVCNNGVWEPADCIGHVLPSNIYLFGKQVPASP